MSRRLIAALMVFTTAFSLGEKVSGELRDGEVHHESTVKATSHSQNSQGEHGHEDDSSHDSEHEHGTSSDHCTHQHGPVLSGVGALREAVLSEVSFSFFAPSLPSDRSTEPFLRPPRA